jgi:hypothetical protein
LHQALGLFAYLRAVATQRLGRSVAAATSTHTAVAELRGPWRTTGKHFFAVSVGC